MKAYELLYFVAPSIDEESRLAVMKRIETALAEGNGVVDNVDNWGKRKLAYEIGSNTSLTNQNDQDFPVNILPVSLNAAKCVRLAPLPHFPQCGLTAFAALSDEWCGL